MNKNCKMTIGAMLLLTTAFSVAEVRSQTCVVPPTCEGLGYDKTASDCSGLAKLRCPFDDSKYFCTAYLNPDGSAPVAVGDIVYSDGTYANPEISQPTKKPVGVVFNNSGYFVALNNYGQFNASNSTISCSGYDSNVKNWRTPSQQQLQEIYNSKITLNKTLSTFLGTTLTGNCAYEYPNEYIYYMNLETGNLEKEIEPTQKYFTRCINSIADIQPNALKIYQVGDSFVKDNLVIGTVVAINDSGHHGIIAFNAGSATKDDAASICNNKNTGGLIWSLASGEHACTLLKNAGSYRKDSTTSSVYVTCAVHVTNGMGACLNSVYYNKGSNQYMQTNCGTSSTLNVVCEAAF